MFQKVSSAARLGLERLDRSLDQLTLYKLMLYFLRLLFAWGVILSFFGVIPYGWYGLVFSASVLIGGVWLFSRLFSRYLDIPRNFESDFITGGILSLIISPAGSPREYFILAGVALAAAVSKYVLVVARRHIFNPAAVGALAAALVFDYPPSWWIGNRYSAPLLILGGLVILRKMHRFTMAGVFLATSIGIFIFNIAGADGGFSVLSNILLASPLLFFTFVMLIEPLTSPSGLTKSAAYAGLVAVLYSVSELGLTPEQALLVGNAFAYVVSRDRRLVLRLKNKRREAEGIYSYLFSGRGSLSYAPGQFLFWTLKTSPTDRRGNRRYFTISSSPTEDTLMLTVKQPDSPSSFKQSLENLKPGGRIYASNLEGSFALPNDGAQKLAFLAGGVGITPFRSMVRYMLDTNQQRDSVLLYSANTDAELAFKNLFDKAGSAGLTTHYIISPERIDAAFIKRKMPDYKERMFFISGPYGFTQAMKTQLQKLGVASEKIKLDYFPGYG